ncbi:hypothetical protein [Streptococcus equi]|uniref:hypothetical protein n=1 Tax=Streptococcus equi TaxID=1336 RepID=UPI001E37CB71|nr:hypothetical protein [Streptococcus equi]MCD3398069.1 hypothetical protein [Streptococcus equi subsp. zooepidemicus]
MKRLISSFCLIVLLGVLVVVNAEENITSKEDYYLDFHDEFDGDSLARTKWTGCYLSHWTFNPKMLRQIIDLKIGNLLIILLKIKKFSHQN